MARIGNPQVSDKFAVNQQAIQTTSHEFFAAGARLVYLNLATFRQRLSAASAELGTFTNSLKNLSTVSAAQAGSVAVIGVESYFLFNVGEIFGRGSLIGYDVGPNGFTEKH
eukprot:CAMPEP_0195517784 /NCGR_PEP_ID=MMETSP0794_2-20130614/11660_1 /TAXON_ID=515487 /ORGANISM="Stephanopyxis turris, Strain CCMP 815" /LENGTH=110 /DNA_ID=CAMNT_0040646655 /DNA_START=90 /DNA_END=422 /DNA_ORIENTATION=+